MIGYLKEMVGFQPAIGRWEYFLRYVSVSMATGFMIVGVMALQAAMAVSSLLTGGLGEALSLIVLAVGMLFAVAYSIMATVSLGVQRLNDLGQSGWFMLCTLIPVVNFFFSLYLLFWPGSGGSNGDWSYLHKNTAILFILCLLCGVAVAIFGGLFAAGAATVMSAPLPM